MLFTIWCMVYVWETFCNGTLTYFLLQGAFKGLSVFSEAVVSNLTGSKPSPPTKKLDATQVDNGNRPGIISIVDLQNIHGDHVSIKKTKYTCIATATIMQATSVLVRCIVY